MSLFIISHIVGMSGLEIDYPDNSPDLRDHLNLYVEGAVDLSAVTALLDSDRTIFVAGCDASTKAIPRLPKKAELLLSRLLRNGEQDALIGDLIECYGVKCQLLGKRKADLYAYTEVLRSLYPLIKRILVKTGVVVLLGEWIRKLSS